MSTESETTSKIAVEERAPAKPAAAETDSANPLRRAALIVVAVTILLFALSIVMERFTPLSSQAVVQAYVIRMAPEVAGRVVGVDVADNTRVEAGQVLFRIDPRPVELAVAEAQAQVEQIGQTLGASTAAVESAQARVVNTVAVNLLSGVLASLAFAFVELRPSLPFLFLTVFLVGLILGGRATAGRAKMYAGALTTFLILFGSGIAPLPTTTPESFATRIGYVLLAVGYTLCMTALFWPRERSVSTQLSLRS